MVARRTNARRPDGGKISQALRELTSEMFDERRLIIASNRGPIEFDIDAHGEIEPQRGSGGVVTALLSRFGVENRRSGTGN